MHFNTSLFLTALGLAFILEGLPYFLFAERLPNFFKLMAERPASNLRLFGCGALILGLGIIFLARTL